VRDFLVLSLKISSCNFMTGSHHGQILHEHDATEIIGNPYSLIS